MTSRLFIAIAALAIILPASAQAQQKPKFSNERETGSSQYVTKWEDVRPQLKRQPMAQNNAGGSSTSPTSLNNTAPASGTEGYVSEMHVGRGIKRAQKIPTSSYNQ